MTEKDEKNFMLALLFALNMYLLSRRYSLYNEKHCLHDFN